MNDYGYYPPTFVDCLGTSEEEISDRVAMISVLVPTETEEKKIKWDIHEIADNINTVW